MREDKVPQGHQIVLFKDRYRFPESELTETRAIMLGRLTIDRRLIGWLIPDSVQPLYLAA